MLQAAWAGPARELNGARYMPGVGPLHGARGGSPGKRKHASA